MNTKPTTPTPTATSVLPQRLRVSIDGYWGGSRSVELRGRVVTYTTCLRDAGPKHTDIQPTDAQWREFRQTIDTLNIWRWLDDYPNPGVLDGSGWSLDIAYSDRAITTHGDNNYPNETGKPNNKPARTTTFNHFLQALQQLIGRKFQ